MRSTVNWFSSEKGFGFIVGDDGKERYFGIRDITGVDFPQNGYLVDFQHQDNPKGPRASRVQ